MANHPWQREVTAVQDAYAALKMLQLDTDSAMCYSDEAQEACLLALMTRAEEAADELASAAAHLQREMFRVRSLRRHKTAAHGPS